MAADTGTDDGLSEAKAREQLTSMGIDDEPFETTLRTDKRVLARVTDGIYRQPGSALRELISNAYDADATRVVLRTDRPRFKRMVIDDNGTGMTSEALIRMLYHIGGSAKRTSEGLDLGITNQSDRNRSPGGRPLIGKIGIGLFSVAQLTQSFQVITKVAGQSHRSIASVTMRQFSDDGGGVDDDDEGQYEAGKVLVWKEAANDLESHGTSIILTAMRPQTQETMRSWNRWQSVFPGNTAEVSGIKPPRFNIGVVSEQDKDMLRTQANVSDLPRSDAYESLPWSPTDTTHDAFYKLTVAIWNSQFEGDPNPRVAKLCDYYLGMVWGLSLEAPLPYIGDHPFDVTGEKIDAYEIKTDFGVQRLQLRSGERVRERLALGDAVRQEDSFEVVVDDLSLQRPIDVTDHPRTSAVLDTPLLFVAQHAEDFDGYDKELSGGRLAFQAYFLWAPRIVPAEHQGVLIRVHNASGTKFDPTFLHFPVAEQRRLTQISCEIFITEGFDGALNIDRESFNFSHPHVVALTRWVHNALRSVIAEQKRLGSQARRTRRVAQTDEVLQRADELVRDVWLRRASTDQYPPRVAFVPRLGESGRDDSQESGYIFDDSVLGAPLTGAGQAQRRARATAQLASIAQALDAFDVLEPLSDAERHQLLSVLRELIETFQ